MARKTVGVLFLVASLVAGRAAVASLFEVLGVAEHEAAVPRLVESTGFDWGAEITDPSQVVAYARRLAEAVPERVRLVEYARSLEGRPLVYLMISSPERIARLDEVQVQLARLADPRGIPDGEVERLAAEVPVVVFVVCSVHGNEASGGDAGLALAYHLAAGDSPEIDEILANALVIIDPVQNPDGRARFLASVQQATGVRPDAERSSLEHDEPWPGGRFSHDLFDLNRDWFALTHPETAGRVAAMLRWHPMVAADLHEMGADGGYFFAPPAAPRHPLVGDQQAALWDVLGRANAAAFDAHGWRYWTREVFDAFYPGYGESWPLFSGGVGMTFEQGSSRGLATRLEDDSILTYADTVRHHLVASFTTCLTAARHRERFVRAWYDYRKGVVAEGAGRSFVLETGADPLRAAALARVLVRQGVEVFEVAEGRGDVKSGSFVVPLSQPMGRLARTLLEKGTSMGEEFEAEQVRRAAKRMPDQIYDLTAWSLPVLWGVEAREIGGLQIGSEWAPVRGEEPVEGTVSGEGRVAFLLPWQGPASAQALARLLVHDVKVGVAGEPFTLDGRRFGRGTVVLRTAANGKEVRQLVEEVARATGVEIIGAERGYVDEGIDLGSNSVRPIEPPRVAIAWDIPAGPTSAGHLRYALERFFGYPVTVVRTATLGRTDLSRFDVIVLPDGWRFLGGYGGVLGESGGQRLAAWVRDGGVLIAVGEGAGWLADEKVGLLSSKLEKRDGFGKDEEAEKPAKGGEPPKKSFDYEAFIQPEDESPPQVMGAILRVDLDTEHYLAAGFPTGAIDVLVSSSRVFAPLKLDKGVNVGTYAEAGKLVCAGFVLGESKEQLPKKAYLMIQEHGRGKVIAFAEDPAARGFTVASMLLLANAVFFAPAF